MAQSSARRRRRPRSGRGCRSDVTVWLTSYPRMAWVERPGQDPSSAYDGTARCCGTSSKRLRKISRQVREDNDDYRVLVSSTAVVSVQQQGSSRSRVKSFLVIVVRRVLGGDV